MRRAEISGGHKKEAPRAGRFVRLGLVRKVHELRFHSVERVELLLKLLRRLRVAAELEDEQPRGRAGPRHGLVVEAEPREYRASVFGQNALHFDGALACAALRRRTCRDPKFLPPLSGNSSYQHPAILFYYDYKLPFGNFSILAAASQTSPPLPLLRPVPSCYKIFWCSAPEWRNGRRSGLKIRRSQGRRGSSPLSGTSNINGSEHFALSRFYFVLI